MSTGFTDPVTSLRNRFDHMLRAAVVACGLFASSLATAAIPNIPGLPATQPALPSWSTRSFLGAWDTTADGVKDAVFLAGETYGFYNRLEFVNGANGTSKAYYLASNAVINGILVAEMQGTTGKEVAVVWSTYDAFWKVTNYHLTAIRNANGKVLNWNLQALPAMISAAPTDFTAGSDIQIVYNHDYTVWPHSSLCDYYKRHGMQVFNFPSGTVHTYTWDTPTYSYNGSFPCSANRGDAGLALTGVSVFQRTDGIFRFDFWLRNGHVFRVRDWEQTRKYE